MHRLIRASFRAVLLGVALGAGVASAGEVVLLGCRDGGYQQEFWIGSGKQLRGQGLAFQPFFCTADQTMRTYTVVVNQVAADKLSELAAKPEPDSMHLSEYFDKADPVDRVFEALFPEIRELTFGDIRGTLDYVARPLTEKIDGSSFVFYSHPLCDSPLIPARYYLQTEKPFPLCQNNGTLKHIMRPAPDPIWD